FKVSGYSRKELLGNTHKLINSGYHSDEFLKNFWETILEGKIWKGELCNKSKGGRLYWVETIIIPIKDKSGKPERLLSIRFDISEKKDKEFKLEKTTHELIEAQKIAKIGNWEMVIGEKSENWSHSILDILELDSKSKINFRKYKLVIHPDDKKSFISQYEDGILKSSEFSIDHRVITNNNNLKWIRSTFRIDSKVAKKVSGILQDISDIKNNEIALKEKDIQMKLINENASSILLELDLNGNIKYISKVAEGVQSSKIIGKNILNWIPDEYKDHVKYKLEEVLKTRKMVEYKVQGQGNFGSLRWYLSRMSPILYNDSIHSIILVSTDITDIVNTENELINAKRDAEKANIAKSEFLANMSHEIRTPLNGVIGFTELLKNTSLTSIQREYVLNSNNSAKALLSIINDILDYSKIEAGKLDLEIIRSDLFEIVNSVIDILKLQSSKKGLELILNLDPSIPSKIYSDSIRLKQVLINLLGNAIKFTHHGYVELSVVCENFKNGSGKFTFSISDTGIGISSENQFKLFSAFSQVDSATTRKFGGTGLGLVISQLLVQKMGGNIKVESEEGKGSRFYFSIEMKAEKVEGNSFETKKFIKNALILDDNPISIIVIENFLKSEGIKFKSYNSGREALENFNYKVKYNIMIIDYSMPGMDGIEFIQELKNINPKYLDDVPIILLFNSSEINFQKERLKEIGEIYYLVKPVKINDLFSVFKRIQMKEKFDEDLEVSKTENDFEIVSYDQIRLLVADDVEMNLILIDTIISQLLPNALILQARNGKEAIEISSKEEIDLILMDLLMPEIDGINATFAIRELEKKSKKRVPIIALTAGVAKEEKEKCLNAGMDDFLTKPVEIEKFKKKLKFWIYSDSKPKESNRFNKYPIFNPSILTDYLGEDKSNQKMFLSRFLEMSESKFAVLIKKMQDNDVEETMEMAHKLAPPSRTIGGERMYRICKEIEEKAKSGFVIKEDISLLKKEFEQLTKSIIGKLNKI
ncbi:MAG: response regulator, partial [Leptospiraceae bacterium]|nr:response regulator [Leptospiraceae bacterium]